MIPPYRPEEIAEAILEADRLSSRGGTRVEVIADEATSSWIISIRETGSDPHRLYFPFASPRGIYTPAEIARLAREGRWPFGKSS